MKSPLFLIAIVSPAVANAAILRADPSNLAAVFASAKNGDTIRATGKFGPVWLTNRSFTTRVTLDATNAVFANTLTVQDVTGLVIVGGTFGSRTAPMRALRAVIVKSSNDVRFQTSNFVGNGLTAFGRANHGMLVRQSRNVQVVDANFSNLHTGLGVMSSSRVKVENSRFSQMTSDGININDSHHVTASANRCIGTIVSRGAHPDCIQLWSLRGQPVQSDIALLGNYARGATQGFASFNGSDGGGLRISMIGNIVDTSYPQGIACYSCIDSIFQDNILTTLPGSRYQTRMNIGGGGNNLIVNNSIGGYGKVPTFVLGGGLTPPPKKSMEEATFLTDTLQMSMSSMAADVPEPMFLSLDDMADTVPEPSQWGMLLVGFGLIGVFSRRASRRSSRREYEALSYGNRS